MGQIKLDNFFCVCMIGISHPLLQTLDLPVYLHPWKCT